MTDSPRLDTSSPALSSPVAVPPLRAARAAVVAVVLTWLPLAVVAVLVWASAARTTVGWGSALGVASLAWVAAHLGSLRADGTVLSLSPLMLTLVPLLVCAGVGRALAAPLADDRSPRLSWLGGVRRGVAAAVGAFVATYLVAGVLVALHASTMPVGPSWPSTLLGLVVIPLVGLLAGASRLWSDPATAPTWHDQVTGLVPSQVRRSVGAGVRGAGLLVLAGLLPVVLTFLTHLGRVRDLTAQLDAGPMGNTALAILQLGWLPDAALWGLSWLAGPGFSVGLGSGYGWRHAQSGLLPMVPVLGALPDDGTFGWWVCLVGLVPVALGAVTAHLALRRLPALSTLTAKALAAGTAWAVAVVLAALAMLLAGGALGSRALADVGPHVLPAAAALAGETGLGALLTLGLARRRYH